MVGCGSVAAAEQTSLRRLETGLVVRNGDGLLVARELPGRPAIVLVLAVCLRVLFLVVGLHHGGDASPRDADVDVVGDLDDQVALLVDRLDDSVETADGENLVSVLDRLEQLPLALLAGALGTDQHQPQHREDQQDDQESSVHEPSSEAPASRASAAARKDWNSPRSIAARACAVNLRTKRRLCRLRSRSPSNSSWLTRCRTYARVNRVQAGQSQPSSNGPVSRA